jgi:beta-glucanase (GH16 family)
MTNGKRHLKRIVFLYLAFFYNQPIKSQLVTAHCVHSSGLRFLLDAYLGSIGACNCQRTGVYLFESLKCNNDPYILDFEDNFDGDSLNKDNWQNAPASQGALKGDQRIDVSILNNVEVSNGVCHIVAKKEHIRVRAVNWKSDNEILEDGLANLRDYDYTDCILFSKRKFHFGKYEIRCKMPEGNGFWPAFWLFGGERYNEIDIFDNYNGSRSIITSIGHDFVEKSVSGCNDSKRGYDLTKWHTFTCEWGADRIIFSIDGNPFRIIDRVVTSAGEPINCGDELAYGSYFQLKAFVSEPMALIFNMVIIGENGPGGSVPVDASTPFPSSFDVDYIRYWKREPQIVNVFPNPTNDILNIKASTIIKEVVIRDFLGNILGKYPIGTDDIKLYLAEYPDGLYIASVFLEGIIKNYRIAKSSFK